MPHDGKVNQTFGVYRSNCCGAEIVITKGAIFPKCADHTGLTTIWKLLPDEDMIRVTDRKKLESKQKPAA